MREFWLDPKALRQLRSSFAVNKVEEDYIPSVQSLLTSVISNPEPTPTKDKEPESTAGQETQFMPATETVPEPMPETEPQPAVSSVPEEKSEVPSDQSRPLHLCLWEYKWSWRMKGD